MQAGPHKVPLPVSPRITGRKASVEARKGEASIPSRSKASVKISAVSAAQGAISHVKTIGLSLAGAPERASEGRLPGHFRIASCVWAGLRGRRRRRMLNVMVVMMIIIEVGVVPSLLLLTHRVGLA